MKKQLLLFAFSALTLASCEDEDTQAYELDMMKGDWKISKTETISGKDDKTVIDTYTPTGCETKNNAYFSTDYSTSYTEYSGTGTNCQVAAVSSGTYEYNSETKDLTLKYKNESPMKFKVVILTSSEMRMKQTSDNIDMDGDTIPDAIYVSYKR